MSEATIALDDHASVLTLFGPQDQHVRRISDHFGVAITHRAGQIRVTGPAESVQRATISLEQLKSVVQRLGRVLDADVAEALSIVGGNGTGSVAVEPSIDVLAAGKQIRPKTPGQAAYIAAIRRSPLVFAEGPAGTGKTYLAVAVAVEAFKQSDVRKIVLVRPAVEAGESLGFLPGDMYAKINPYLRPLLDALYEMMNYEQVRQYMERDSIEVIPLAYMRGRTLNDAFIILDEAQNTTVSQMKMFLTRMGHHSRIVIAGDSTQVDLPPHTQSGMNDAMTRLRTIEGVHTIRLGKPDIVRHRLVQDIVNAYEDGRKKRR